MLLRVGSYNAAVWFYLLCICHQWKWIHLVMPKKSHLKYCASLYLGVREEGNRENWVCIKETWFVYRNHQDLLCHKYSGKQNYAIYYNSTICYSLHIVVCCFLKSQFWPFIALWCVILKTGCYQYSSPGCKYWCTDRQKSIHGWQSYWLYSTSWPREMIANIHSRWTYFVLSLLLLFHWKLIVSGNGFSYSIPVNCAKLATIVSHINTHHCHCNWWHGHKVKFFLGLVCRESEV